jgi:predicted transglutaminase-like cysteine proteinase
MRRTRWLSLVRVAAAAALLLAAGTATARPTVASATGPRFVGYPTAHADAAPRFDFARLDEAPAREVREIAAAVAGLPPLAQLAAVNARINRVPFRDDWSNYGVADHWATPREFFRRGGDCEDFAIAKYAVLERLGWPPARMWIVVLRETVMSQVHAVLMVEHDGRLWTLDNLGDRPFEHGRLDYYRPAYSLNRFGSWSHGGPVTLAGGRGGAVSGR